MLGNLEEIHKHLQERGIGRTKLSKASKMTWLETMPPLIIIGGMLCVAGTSQHVLHKLFYGKPKHPGSDLWDKAMEQRDARLLEEVARKQTQ